ncbi:MAG: S-layer homology domain-containing protein [Oscillospiraceae bacterium]|nr:S-layer homology domain-containing protein [Oscillospiraceae bacterium]
MRNRVKRILALLLCFVLAAGLLPGALAADGENPFTDVKASDYFYEAVVWAYENDVTKGTSETAFSPWGACTRGQVVTFLWRAKGQPKPKTAENPFADVPETAYYRDAVLWAVEQGITNGTGKNAFSPDTPCVYAHILTFIWRSVTGKTSSSYGEWYAEPMDWAEGQSLLSETALGKDREKVMENCPRCDVVTYLWRVLKPGPGKDFAATKSDAQNYVKAMLDLITTGTYDKSVNIVDIDDNWNAESYVRQGIYEELDEVEWLTDEVKEMFASAVIKGMKKAQYEVGTPVDAENGYDVPVTIRGVDISGAMEEAIDAATGKIMEDPNLSNMSESEIYNRVFKDAAEYLTSWLDEPEYVPPVTIYLRYTEISEGLYGCSEADGRKVGIALFGGSLTEDTDEKG